jgi:hypothetical protein
MKLNHLNLAVDDVQAATFYFQAPGDSTIEVLS